MSVSNNLGCDLTYDDDKVMDFQRICGTKVRKETQIRFYNFTDVFTFVFELEFYVQNDLNAL